MSSAFEVSDRKNEKAALVATACLLHAVAPAIALGDTCRGILSDQAVTIVLPNSVGGGFDRTVRFPGLTVLADRNDRGGLAVDDGGVAAARGGHLALVQTVSSPEETNSAP